MRTTIYLATACGLAVIQGCDEGWVGEVCLNDKRIQCVAADRTRKGIVYCGTRSEDDGLQWQKLAVQWNSKATAEHATGMAIVEEG